MADKTVDARGLTCPQPVILAKKALEACACVQVIVDNETARENVKRLGAKEGCDVEVEARPDGAYRVRLSRRGGGEPSFPQAGAYPEPSHAVTGPFVVVLSDDRMGRGPDELGQVLMRAFLHTLGEQKERPDTIVFYNSGVKLATRGSAVLDDLTKLAEAGVEMLVCGTCVNYFDIGKDVAVGTVSNMYDIAGVMSRSGRLVTP